MIPISVLTKELFIYIFLCFVLFFRLFTCVIIYGTDDMTQ